MVNEKIKKINQKKDKNENQVVLLDIGKILEDENFSQSSDSLYLKSEKEDQNSIIS